MTEQADAVLANLANDGITDVARESELVALIVYLQRLGQNEKATEVSQSR